MVTRLNTGPGGTCGPQGGATITVPEANAVTRAQSVPMDGVYAPGPSVEPFVLYNFDQDGAAANLDGRGTSGNKFRQVRTGTYWDNSNYASLYAELSPFYSTLADFGGSWCYAPLTAIIQTESSGGVSEVQWVMTDNDTWGGLAVNTQVDASAGSPYISMEIEWIGIGGSPPTYATTAYWDLSTATLAASNLFVMTLQPASTSHSLLINGAAFTAGTSHANNAPDCETLDGGVFPALAKSDVFNATDITGMAWTRGAADNAYWSTYDWATHPGFA